MVFNRSKGAINLYYTIHSKLTLTIRYECVVLILKFLESA